jgi:membrane protein YdbS with pleckstrin-like domain
MKNWKTTVNGILAFVIATAGPFSPYLASLNKPWAASAAGVVTLIAAIARVWIGLIQNDAPPNPK